jgi:glycosyltransferase involved in cell wall biosynthesis
MAKALLLHGIETRMVSADGEADPSDFLAESFNRENGGRWGFCYNSALFSRMRRLVGQSDIVHVHGLWNFPASLAARLASDARIPYVITLHGMLTPWSLSQSRLKKTVYSSVAEKRNIRKASALHFFSEMERLYSETWGTLARTIVLPNGVQRASYDQENDRMEMERLFPVLEGKRVILFLGRLHPGKGLDLLLPAFASLLPAFPDLALVVAGPEAEYGREMSKLIKKLGISERVLAPGLVKGNTKRVLLGGSDMFVLPSRHEGDSIAIKEAMQAGLPAVITPGCHFPMAAERGAAIVVELDVEELTTGIRDLLANPVRRAEMGTRGRQMVEAFFTWERIALEFKSVYLELLGDRGSRTSPNGSMDPNY